MSDVEDSNVGKAVKSMLEKDHKVYAVTRLGIDIKGNESYDYVRALENLIRDAATSDFMERAVHMHEWVWPSKIFIIGGEVENIEDETYKLISLVRQCPGGPVYERALKDQNPERRLKFQEFAEDVKKKGKRVLTIEYGPAYFFKEDFKAISELFLMPILRNAESGYCMD